MLSPIFVKHSRREKCPNTEFFQVCIFPYSDSIQENTDQKKLRISSMTDVFQGPKYAFVNYSRVVFI